MKKNKSELMSSDDRESIIFGIGMLIFEIFLLYTINNLMPTIMYLVLQFILISSLCIGLITLILNDKAAGYF